MWVPCSMNTIVWTEIIDPEVTAMSLTRTRRSCRSHGVAILEVAGEIDRADAEAIAARAIELLGSARCLVVDLTDVQFLGASAIGAILEIHAAAAHGARLRLVTSPENRVVRRPIELTNLQDTLVLHPTVDDALATLRPRRGAGDGGEVDLPATAPVRATRLPRVGPCSSSG